MLRLPHVLVFLACLSVRAGVAATAAPPPADFKAINGLLGLPVLADENLWDDTPAAIAARLSLPAENTTARFESYRTYPKEPLEVLGSPGYMISLKAAEGRPTALTVMFANRGDYPGFTPGSTPSPEAIRTFEQVLKKTFQTLGDRLTARLGSPRRTNGGGLDSGRQALRWEVARCVFLFTHDPGQLVALKIIPGEQVKTTRPNDEQLRLRLKGLVARRPSGDVILDQLPMVDQGPKGYCLPATFERCLRYFDIPADMYELAAVGGVGFGGGGSFDNMAAGLERYVQREGRRLERVEAQLTIARLAPFLDSGRPVLWGLSSAKAFNELANTHSDERKKTTDWTAWKQTAATAAKTPLGIEHGTGHACLIIGYNRATNEIAFTDSWGPNYAERWVPIAAAAKVSHDQFWVMSW